MSSRASAARYARALLDVVITEGNPEQVDEDLAAFAALVAGAPDLQRALTNPAVPVSAKRGILDTLLSRVTSSGPLAKLLQLLADRDRLGIAGDLAAGYHERLMEHRQVVRAEVVTATPLAPERLAWFEQRLASATGRRVTMSARVDPTLIGGAVARVGSLVYDGSIATQLAKIRERLEKTA
ncbi:MAG: ATP synthase F1 subunit delta [Acidobacteria bacterium RIFCSPLOWO2_02_FULL_68_18]|nr:MAG: ATP synthase F1 subunit delta [Acidobacteria bacterium RIFCSPLOWO2_02_FULL_68_18]OFW49641.1 MAG: ATP synthase F1 subunit delta [Acidobacteria bacterium RIFCSPLOWO2_12_FULL_68_19]